MSYVEENLLKGEQVIYQTRLHWRFYTCARGCRWSGRVHRAP